MRTKNYDYHVDTIFTERLNILDRIVYLMDGIDDESLEFLVKCFHILGKAPLTIILDSGGGDVTPGLAMVDLIKRHGKITIEVWGRAESMAGVILQAAAVRKMSESSHLMLHSGLIEPAPDTTKNVKAYIKLSERQDDLCDELVITRIQKKHPKYSWTTFRKETKDDVYFTSEQALHWNLVDEIIK